MEYKNSTMVSLGLTFASSRDYTTKLHRDFNNTFANVLASTEYVTTDNDSKNSFSTFVSTNIYQYGAYVTSSLAILTNILILVTMKRSWNFWKYSTGILLVALGSVDIINNIMNFFLVHVKSHPYLVGRIQPLFVIMAYLQTTLSNISNHVMVLISLNRYALVCKPFKHYKVTSRKSTLAQITAVVTILLVVNIYIFSKKNKLVFNICFFVMYVLLSHIIPILISVVLTILVNSEFKNNNNNKYGTSKSMASVKLGPGQGESNITKAMIAVNVAFIILTVPHAISHIVYLVLDWIHDGNPDADQQINNSFVAILILTLMRDINYSINIIIYAAYIPKFRVTLLELFKCKCKCKDDNDGSAGQLELDIHAPNPYRNPDSHSNYSGIIPNIHM